MLYLYIIRNTIYCAMKAKRRFEENRWLCLQRYIGLEEEYGTFTDRGILK